MAYNFVNTDTTLWYYPGTSSLVDCLWRTIWTATNLKKSARWKNVDGWVMPQDTEWYRRKIESVLQNMINVT